jgi:hypothetical protein
VELGKATQKVQVSLAPIDNVFVIVAARDRPAHHQEQHLAQRIGNLPALPRIVDPREVIEQQTQSWLGRKG